MGQGDCGQLGITEEQPKAGFCHKKPVLVKLVKGQDVNPPISKITRGDMHCMALLEGTPGKNGDIYTWEFGEKYALGHGGDKDKCLPCKLYAMKAVNHKCQEINPSATPLNADIQLIAGGGQHSGITIISSSSIV